MAELNESQRQELRSHAKVARDAVVEGARQMSILWEARLNMAMAMGDDTAMRNAVALREAEMYMDNCNCGGTGGSSFFG